MSRKLEEQLAALSRLRDQPVTEDTVAELRAVLASRSSSLVSRAARLVGELELEGLGDALAEAFFRFLQHPDRDKGCVAKTAIAEAAYLGGSGGQELFLAGIGHVQLEPVWGGRVDTAAELRGHCAMGLVRIGYHEVLVCLARLLADPEAVARQAAARAIGYAGQDAGVPLLVLWVLSGDGDPQVMGECLSSLLALAPEHGLELAAHLLEDDAPEIVEAVALAVGESRLRAALPVLTGALQSTREADARRSLLLGIALLRRDEAIDYLVSLISDAPVTTAAAAVTALGMYRHDERLLDQVRSLVRERAATSVSRAFEEAFE